MPLGDLLRRHAPELALQPRHTLRHLDEGPRHRGGRTLGLRDQIIEEVQDPIEERIDAVGRLTGEHPEEHADRPHGSRRRRGHQLEHLGDHLQNPAERLEDRQHSKADQIELQSTEIADHLPERGHHRAKRHQPATDLPEDPEDGFEAFREATHRPRKAALQVVQGIKDRLQATGQAALQRLPALGADRLEDVLEVALDIGERSAQNLLALIQLLQLLHQVFVEATFGLQLLNGGPVVSQLLGQLVVHLDVTGEQGAHLGAQLLARDAQHVHAGCQAGAELADVAQVLAFLPQRRAVLKDQIEPFIDLAGGGARDLGDLPLDLLVLPGDDTADGAHLIGGPLDRLAVRAQDPERLRGEDPRFCHLLVEAPGLLRQLLQRPDDAVHRGRDAEENGLQALGRQAQLAQHRQGLAGDSHRTAQGAAELAHRAAGTTRATGHAAQGLLQARPRAAVALQALTDGPQDVVQAVELVLELVNLT